MITEDYVSFETAKLLKEKGFEYDPDESYWLIDVNNKMYWVSRIGAYDYVDVPTESFQRPKNGYRLVTQAMAMKWLREKHNQNITVKAHNNVARLKTIYYAEVQNLSELAEKGFCVNGCIFKDTYEEAVEYAIRYCLKNLI